MKTEINDYLQLLARIFMSGLFLYSGIGKLMAPEATMAYIGNAGLPMPSMAYAVALIVELTLPLALIIGYRLPAAAIGLGIYTLATALVFHSNFSEKMQVIAFLKNAAIFGGLLQMAISRTGCFSIERETDRNKR